MNRHTRRAFGAFCLSLAASLARAAGKPSPMALAPPIAGALLPLSGDFSLAGDEVWRGIQLANAACNPSLPLFSADMFDASQAPAAAKRLTADDHAGLLFGSGASALSYPGSAAAELAQIPYIELNAPADGIMTRGFHFLVRTGITTTQIAATAIAGINARYPGAKIGLLFNTGATCGAIAAAVLANWRAAKTPPLLVIGYPPDAADLHEPAARLRRAGAEILLHAADAGDVLILFAALADAGWTPKAMFGAGDGYQLRETAEALGPAFDDVFATGAPFYPPRASYIATAYEDRFAMPPRSADSLSAYVGAKLVFDTLTQAGGDVTKLLDNLLKSDIPAGTLANGWGAAFDKTGQNTRSFPVLQRWKNQMLTAL